jgi:hypothetical protein
MKGGRVRHGGRFWTFLLVVFASLVLLRTTHPDRMLPDPARRFFSYYRALGASEAKISTWQRLLFSAAMAAAPERSDAGAATSL